MKTTKICRHDTSEKYTQKRRTSVRIVAKKKPTMNINKETRKTLVKIQVKK
jgi:hypothetical protein